MTFSIPIDKKLNFTILKKKNKKFIIIFSKNYFLKYCINIGITMYYNKSCRSLILKTILFTKYTDELRDMFNTNNYSLVNYYTKKIKFTGKSYKIKKSSNYFSFEFNKSHLEIILWKNSFIKKLKKAKILISSANPTITNFISSKIINIRPINPFTKRGLRNSRGIVFKKIGKKSSS